LGYCYQRSRHMNTCALSMISESTGEKPVSVFFDFNIGL
jgi:hypothetical protein